VKTEAITLVKEDVLSLGQMVNKTVEEVAQILRLEPGTDIGVIEEREELINDACQAIEEKCLELLLAKDVLDAREIRALVSSIMIAAKFERLADHANRISRMVLWAREDGIEIPPQLAEMADVIHCMVQDVLLSFVTDDEKKAQAVVLQDNQVNYLHDLLSNQLLSDLGEQDQAGAQMRMQFLFCARFLERMGDACASIARRVFFIATGKHLKKQSIKVT
jgi:phosphate transport system regulatory protein PhoU